MQIIILQNDLYVKNSNYETFYKGANNLEQPDIKNCYIGGGTELKFIIENLRKHYFSQHPEISAEQHESTQIDFKTLGLLVFANEKPLLSLPKFPQRLGRMVANADNSDFYTHLDLDCLALQLSHLRQKFPNKKHFRIAVINGFGGNLGDCTMGVSAFALVYKNYLQKFLATNNATFSVEALLDMGANRHNEQILLNSKLFDRITFINPTVADFMAYDAYFDFSGIIALPKYDELPTFDFYLWWMGVDYTQFADLQKRNFGQILFKEYQAVQNLLRDKSGAKIFFNPKASVPLRTMPDEVAAEFIEKLLKIKPDIKIVIDREIFSENTKDFHEKNKKFFEKNKRVINLAGKINSPEKFKALIAQMDGIISVNTYATHVADFCDIPCVQVCSVVPAEIYPYYPFAEILNVENYQNLPFYKKCKTDEKQWQQVKNLYLDAWKKLQPQQVWDALECKINLRKNSANSNANANANLINQNLTMLSQNIKPFDNFSQRFYISSAHQRSSQILQNLIASNLIKLGSKAIFCGVYDFSIIQNLSQKIGQNGEIFIIEPRKNITKMLNLPKNLPSNLQIYSDLITAKFNTDISFPKINVFTEMHSNSWGNVEKNKLTIKMQNQQTIDEFMQNQAINFCNLLVINSPFPIIETLQGCHDLISNENKRPPIIFNCINQKQQSNILQMAMKLLAENSYESFAVSIDDELFILSLPKEIEINLQGFKKIQLA